MAKETMTALMVAPGMNPCEISLYQEQSFLKAAVSFGLEEVADELNFWRLSEQAGILYARYAVLWNGKVNRRIEGRVFAGTFYIIGISGRKLASLSPADIERYREQFWEPLELTQEDEAAYIMSCIEALYGDTELYKPYF